jgi:hypothetical protein
MKNLSYVLNKNYKRSISVLFKNILLKKIWVQWLMSMITAAQEAEI